MVLAARGVCVSVLTLAMLMVGGCADWGRGELGTVGIERAMLFGFDSPADVEAWRSVNDTVAGGGSQGRLVYGSAGVATFAGNVSPDPRGGLASVRADLPDNALQGVQGLILRVRGDGRRYIVYAKTNRRDNGYVYQMSFQTQLGRWRDVLVPFPDLGAHCRWVRRLPWQHLTDTDITGIGLMIADDREGPFELEIDTIQVYSVPGGP
jgi:monofunctional biosynthetic peptidoglycan transglycosylase